MLLDGYSTELYEKDAPKIRAVTEGVNMADSISASRLMIFNANMIHISGENGEWISPEKGQKIYYKIKNYLSGGKFYIHYPCEKIEYIARKHE